MCLILKITLRKRFLKYLSCYSVHKQNALKVTTPLFLTLILSQQLLLPFCLMFTKNIDVFNETKIVYRDVLLEEDWDLTMTLALKKSGFSAITFLYSLTLVLEEFELDWKLKLGPAAKGSPLGLFVFLEKAGTLGAASWLVVSDSLEAPNTKPFNFRPSPWLIRLFISSFWWFLMIFSTAATKKHMS